MPAGGPPVKAAQGPAVEAGSNLVRFQGGGAPLVEGFAPTPFRNLYTLDQNPLGEGRYSRVYAATHRITGARRAVKTAMRKGASHQIQDFGMECPARLAGHEARILKSLDHHNVIRLHEVYEEEAMTHLVLELCEGSDVLERILSTQDRLTEADISNLFVQMLAGIWHIHSQGAAHRDLKPEHFLFTRREPDRAPAPPWKATVKIIDFGLGHLDGISFRPGGGTPQFMPPEANANGRIVDVKDMAVAQAGDMWSLGVVLHAMLVGHYPSPKLNDKTMAAYLKKPAWQSFSTECLDMMASMLKQKHLDRITSAQALQHHWAVNAARARGPLLPCLATELPKLVHRHAASPGFLRLALRAVAREVDDFEAYEVRNFFQVLLSRCQGEPTADALKKLAESGEELQQVALALHQEFETLHGSAKGGITWSEFLAVVLASSHLAQSMLSALATPLIVEDAVWRAFDVLRYDTPTVSGATLVRLCPPTTPDEADVAPLTDQYTGLIKQVFPTGSVEPKDFADLVNGKVKMGKTDAAGPGRPSAIVRLLTCSCSSGSGKTSGAADNKV